MVPERKIFFPSLITSIVEQYKPRPKDKDFRDLSTNIHSRSEHKEEDLNVLVIFPPNKEPDHFPMARIVSCEYAQSDFSEMFKTSRLHVDAVATKIIHSGFH